MRRWAVILVFSLWGLAGAEARAARPGDSETNSRRARLESIQKIFASGDKRKKAAAWRALRVKTRDILEKVDIPRIELKRVSQRMIVAIADGELERIDELLQKREESRKLLRERHVELYELLPELKAELKKEQFSAWSGILSGKPKKRSVSQMENAKDLYNEAKRFYKRVRHEMNEEEVLFQAQLAKIEEMRSPAGRIRLMSVPALIIAILVLILSGVSILLLRSRAQLRSGAEHTAGPAPGYGAPGLAAPAPAGPAVIGGSYRIEAELGRGAMGIVYEAVDLKLRRKVAIKQMREELRRSPKDLELFLSEARMVASFQHPNIVQIFNVLEDGGEVFLVFERVDGRPLNEILDQEPRLSLPAALRMTRQVGSALDYAHERKVIHRDLKTANVMVAADGTAKVMDFGIAHQVQLTVARMTRAESWGTPPYMAPEQELGSVSRESDLYSLAVCFYEMVTGDLPFGGPNFLAQKNEMLFRPPSQAAPGLPSVLDAVLRRAFAPESNERFHSAAEFIAALERSVL